MLKERYEDYTEQEFLSLCERVFNVEGDAASHERLVAELDMLVDAPGWEQGLIFAAGRPLAPLPRTPLGLMRMIKHCRGRRPGLKPGGDLQAVVALVPLDEAMSQREAQRTALRASGEKDQNLGHLLQRLLYQEQQTERELLAGATHMHEVQSLLAIGDLQQWQRCVQLRDALNELEKVLHRLAPLDRFTKFSRTWLYDAFESRRVRRNSPAPVEGWEAWAAHWHERLAEHDIRMSEIGMSVDHLRPTAEAAFIQGKYAWVRGFAALHSLGGYPLHYEIPLADALSRALLCHPDRKVMDFFSSPDSGLTASILSAVALQVAGTDPAWALGACAHVYEFGRQAWRADPYVLTVPLELIAPVLDRNSLYRENIPLPYRLLLRSVSGVFKVSVCKSTPPLASEVPVLAATALPESDGYQLSLPSGEIFQWRFRLPLLSQENALTGPMPSFGRVEPGKWFEPQPIDTMSLDGFYECVVVFPQGSGMGPLYLSCARVHDYAGLTTGAGAAEVGQWFDRVRAGGAGLPAPLAAALAQQPWEDFEALKRAIWQRMTSVPVLASQCSAEQLEAMAAGNAPLLNGQPIVIGHRTPPSYSGLYDLGQIWFTFPAPTTMPLH